MSSRGMAMLVLSVPYSGFERQRCPKATITQIRLRTPTVCRAGVLWMDGLYGGCRLPLNNPVEDEIGVNHYCSFFQSVSCPKRKQQRIQLQSRDILDIMPNEILFSIFLWARLEINYMGPSISCGRGAINLRNVGNPLCIPPRRFDGMCC